ncbi:MAG: hypothetical protein ACI35O_05655 [Bacillaceae bacterium]
MRITILSSLQINTFTNELKESFTNSSFNNLTNLGDIRTIFKTSERVKIPEPILTKIIEAMSHSITVTFSISFIGILITIIFILLMGNTRVELTNTAKMNKTMSIRNDIHKNRYL